MYEAKILVPDPKNPGLWIPKKGNSHTMFPVEWDEIRIQREVDTAWNSSEKKVGSDGVWNSVTPSGVRVKGYLEPRVTAYPLCEP